MAEQIRTERLVVEAIDRALADVQGRSALSSVEVVDQLLDLRTVVGDIVRVESMEVTRRSDPRTRFPRLHPHRPDAVPDRR